MSEKEQFDAFMSLCEFRFNRWANRRQYEWRISVGLWAILVAGMIYIQKPSGALLWLLILGLVIAVLGHAWLWVRWNWISNERDIRTAFFFAEHAERLLRSSNAPDPGARPEITPEEKRWYGFLRAGARRLDYSTEGQIPKLVRYCLRKPRSGWPNVLLSARLADNRQKAPDSL